MVCAWLSRWLPRRTAHRQIQSKVSVSSNYDSPFTISTPEIIKPQAAQKILDSQELHKPQAPSLKLLPTELILLVSEFLSTADTVCLFLTCKRMWYISDGRDLAHCLDTDTTETLLCRLERDITGVSYCAVDQKLLRIKTYNWTKLHHHIHSAKQHKGPADVHFGYSRFWLTWCTARLVTNYQILGPQYGIPASSLAHTYERPCYEQRICSKQVWVAKVIHGELFISCTYTYFPVNADASTLRAYFETHTTDICKHTEIGAGIGYWTLVGLPTHMIGNTQHHYMGCCWTCETDWETFIERTDTKRGWMVRVQTYHALGTCRSSSDPKWRVMTNRSGPMRETPRGAVKASWDKV